MDLTIPGGASELQHEFNVLASQSGIQQNAELWADSKMYGLADEWLRRVKDGTLRLEVALSMCALVGHYMGLRIMESLAAEERSSG